MGTKVRNVHSSHLTCSQLVLVSSCSSRKYVGKSYPSQRTRMSHLVIESTASTLSFIYEKLRNSIRWLRKFLIIYFCGQKLSHFFSPYTEYLLWVKNFNMFHVFAMAYYSSTALRDTRVYRDARVYCNVRCEWVSYYDAIRQLKLQIRKAKWDMKHVFVAVLPTGTFKFTFIVSSQLSRDFRQLHLSTLSHSSRTRVWMSTFVRTSSHSQLPKSLNECPRRKCKLGIIDVWGKLISFLI